MDEQDGDKKIESMTSEGPLDLLNRQEFVDRLLKVVETLAATSGSASYAIEGEWGVGKTYVLEEFERELGQQGYYFVFHYNCWQNDFYEEPLIAIVATLLDQLEKKGATLPVKVDKETLQTVVRGLTAVWNIAGLLIKINTGVDLRMPSGETSKKEQKTTFDTYQSLKRALQGVQTAIKLLAKVQPIIFVVDELDRCLPEYAIHVLERLHHLFHEMPNVQVILAVDATQLSNTVKQIYGQNIDAKRYLEKFIAFRISLPTGQVSNDIMQTYPHYFDSFTYDISPRTEVGEACSTFLTGLNFRKAKAIVEKSALCHQFLNPSGTRCDGALAAVEIFLAYFYDQIHDAEVKRSGGKIVFDLSTVVIPMNGFKVPPGLLALAERWRGTPNHFSEPYVREESQPRCFLFLARDTLGLLLGCCRMVMGYREDYWRANRYEDETVGAIPLRKYVDKFWEFLNVID